MNSIVGKWPLATPQITVPEGLRITTADTPARLWTLMGEHAAGGGRATILNGTFYVQGGRGFFTCAVSVLDYLGISALDNAKRGDTVAEVAEASTRPTDTTHLKGTTDYLMETAVQGARFILPSFILNYGTHSSVTEDTDDETDLPNAELIVVARDNTLIYPALLLIPEGMRLPATDGAHRTKALQRLAKQLSSGKNADPAQYRKLMTNALPLVISFEGSLAQVHQDFADCAQTKAMSASVRNVYDGRDIASTVARQLTQNVPFLLERVDGTAQGFNVSVSSPKVYTQAAMRSHVQRIRDMDVEHTAKPSVLNSTTLIEFWEELTASLPVFKALVNTPAREVREQRGGSVWLKPAGLALLARVYWTMRARDIPLAKVIGLLELVDDGLLNADQADRKGWDARAGQFNDRGDRLGYDSTASEFVNPLFAEFWKVSRDRASISSNTETVDAVWKKLAPKLGMDGAE